MLELKIKDQILLEDLERLEWEILNTPGYGEGSFTFVLWLFNAGWVKGFPYKILFPELLPGSPEINYKPLIYNLAVGDAMDLVREGRRKWEDVQIGNPPRGSGARREGEPRGGEG